jgi:hypothetical protein
MKKRNKWALLIVFGLAIVIIAGLVSIDTPLSIFKLAAIRATQMRVRLLHETDHQALLKDGREILSKVQPIERQIKKGHAYSGYVPVPKDVKDMGLPKTMRKLKLRSVGIRQINHQIYLTIEMHGGMDHFGVNIYPEDFNDLDVPTFFSYGNRELVPGLWYYDEGYVHNPQFDQIVSEAIQKGRWVTHK